MIKAFLSHSSVDKEAVVRPVADWLDRSDVIYDEYSFEEGAKTIDEIMDGLDDTELFVFFISNASLESAWVKREVSGAKVRIDESKIAKFYPIIVDDSVTHDDVRIPEWIRDHYNLRPIKRARVIARRIRDRLRELAWSKHPRLKERQQLFVGRNAEQEVFEQRLHDYTQPKPLVIFASGMEGVGRRTFLHRALCKTGISSLAQRPAAVYLDRDVSIEDFILKLNDLGLLDIGEQLLGLSEKSVSEKCEIVHQIMNAAIESREIIFLLDQNCVVTYKREIAPWFQEIISKFPEPSGPIFCIASHYQVNFRSRPRGDSKYFYIELRELNPHERQRLLAQLLEIDNIDLSVNDFGAVVDLLTGLPEQVMYAVDLIGQDSKTPLVDKLPSLSEYSNDRAAKLLEKFETDADVLDFIRLLAQFEVISKDFVFSIVPESDYFSTLEELAAENICEFIGIEGEIVRLSDVVRDYITRNRFQIRREFARKTSELVEHLVETEDLFERDSSEYIFAIKEALKEGRQVDQKFLIPSHYLRCMRDLYYNTHQYDRIVELADIILAKSNYLDDRVVQDIRYYLCQSLARKRDPRMLKEVQAIRGPEHNFLLGFYYRRIGRFADALDRFLPILNEPFISNRVGREIVQVYIQTGQYDAGLAIARKNYESNRGN